MKTKTRKTLPTPAPNDAKAITRAVETLAAIRLGRAALARMTPKRRANLMMEIWREETAA